MNKIGIFLRGIAMGIAVLIPGISGGTIAFITGIYERLVFAIRGIQISWVFLLLKFIITQKNTDYKKAKKSFLSMDFEILTIFTLGVVLTILLGSGIITYLLDHTFIYIVSVFIGLIIGSIYIIRSHITVHGIKEFISVSCGILIGLAVILLIPIQDSPQGWVLVIIGFVSTSAMFLPGISGTHLLFILGAYELVLNMIKTPLEFVKEIILFGIGGVTALLIVSRVISYLLKHHHSITLYVLIGLAIGTLYKPISEILVFQPFSIIQIGSMCVLGIIGLLIPLILNKYHKG